MSCPAEYKWQVSSPYPVRGRNSSGTYERIVATSSGVRPIVMPAPAVFSTSSRVLVFGTERAGLSARQVSRCHLIAMIPANEAFSSLNLAQAVQVFAYELRMAAGGGELSRPRGKTKEGTEPATHEEMEGLYAQLEEAFYATGFLDPAEPKRLMQRMRRLFARARPEKTEVNVLRGFLTAIRARSKVE